MPRSQPTSALVSPAQKCFQVAQADGVKPEHVVQSVVQAGGDEQTVQESIDILRRCRSPANAVAQSNQNAEAITGPYLNSSDNRSHDGTKAVMIATLRLLLLKNFK